MSDEFSRTLKWGDKEEYNKAFNDALELKVSPWKNPNHRPAITFSPRIETTMNQYYKTIDPEASPQMFDFGTFYQRMAQELPNDFKAAEIGLSNGKSVIFLASALSHLNKHGRLVGIDNMAYGGEYQATTIVNHIIKSGENIELMIASSLDASCKFPDGYFDLVFIDSSHEHEQTRAEILLWQRKVKDGGILAGHDYNIGCHGVMEAVNEAFPNASLEETSEGFNVWWIKIKK